MSKRKWTNKYKINENYPVIRGGNADVYQVTRISDNKIFALKEQRNLNGGKKLRFKREIKIVLDNQDSNKGILKIIDYSDTDDKGYWYITPWAKPIIESLKNKKIEDIVSAIIEIGRTLEFLHAKDISHRDIKPDNIFFLDGGYVLGDFGLVHYPGCISCTQTESHLGAWSTMAPEMRRNPKTSDGKKADVYSLAKTLWILITGNKLGFDGEYTLEFPIVLEVDKEAFSTAPYSIVDIHELLLDSTKNIPDLRPDMKTFCDRLQAWLDETILENSVKWQLSQQKEWRFIEKLLFIKPPQRAFWEDKEEIVNILNLIAKTDQLSHFIIDFGGDDLKKAELSTREGEILINNILIKPQKLVMERIEKNSMWNYFILEIQEDKQKTDIYNRYALLPDGKLVDDDGIDYGVFDYDSGVKLPDGYKIVQRYNKGNILFVPKSGFYNAIRAAYDGRHFEANIDTFREYTKFLHSYFIKFYDGTISVEEFLNNNVIFTKNLLKKEKQKNKIEDNVKQNKLPSVTNKYLLENYKNWDFSERIKAIQSNPTGMVKYFIYFHTPNDVLSLIKKRFEHQCLILCRDGFVRECSYLDNEKSDILYFSNVDEAEEVCEKCRNLLKNILESEGYYLIYNHLSVDMIRNFNRIPDYEFTVEDIRNTIYNADDRLDNYLIINELGRPEMVHPTIIHDSLYPVRGPYWGSNGGYTGKYSNYTNKEIEKIYNDFRNGWLRYLKNGTAQFVE